MPVHLFEAVGNGHKSGRPFSQAKILWVPHCTGFTCKSGFGAFLVKNVTIQLLYVVITD